LNRHLWVCASGLIVVIIIGVLFGFSVGGFITSYNLIWATGVLIVTAPMIMYVPYFNYSVKEIQRKDVLKMRDYDTTSMAKASTVVFAFETEGNGALTKSGKQASRFLTG